VGEQVREALSNVRTLLGASTPQARQALRRIEARFTVEPTTLPDGRRGVRFVGEGSYRRLLANLIPLEASETAFSEKVASAGGSGPQPARTMVVPGGGIEPPRAEAHQILSSSQGAASEPRITLNRPRSGL
jgi:hypothetical protein